MKRIGITASRIAKGNLWLYNVYVLILSFLLCLLVFFLSGFTLIVGLALISFITRGFMVVEMGTGFSALLITCMIALTVVVGVMYLFAVMRNFKIRK
jgi:hypothetical protein